MIKDFESTNELKTFLSGKVVKYIDGRTEGKCYLGKDNLIYKTLGIDGLRKSQYDVDKIITRDKFNNNSFAFPIDLYLINKELTAYSMNYVGKDLFSSYNTSSPMLIAKLDFKKFTKAYKVMLNDIIKLSKEKIELVDLPLNIIYDGDKLTGIDTLDYHKVDYDPIDKNLESYYTAIEDIFRLCYNEYMDSNLDFDGKNINDYLKKVENRLPTKYKEYRKQLKRKRK